MFHVVRFSPVLSPILDTDLSLVSVIYQLQSLCSYMCQYVAGVQC